MPFFFFSSIALFFVTNNEGIRLFNVWLIMIARKREFVSSIWVPPRSHMTSQEKERQDWKVFGNCIFYAITVYYSGTVGKNHKNTWQGILFLLELCRADHGASVSRLDKHLLQSRWDSGDTREKNGREALWILDSSAFSKIFCYLQGARAH